MKLLIFSDLHLHLWNYGATTTAEGINSRLLAQQDVLSRIKAYIEANNIDVVVFCGDLFHTHDKINAYVLNCAADFFSWFRNRNTYVYVLVGNHDRASGDHHSLNWLWNYRNVEVIGDFTEALVNGFIFRCLGYTPFKGHLESHLLDVSLRNDEPHVLFMHQGVRGVKLGNGFELPDEILTPEMIPDNVKMAFTGHYHKHQRISKNLMIVGSVMQHTWADAGDERGWVVYDTDSDEPKLVPSRAPEFQYVDMGGANSTDRYTWQGVNVENNYIRVKNWLGSVEEIRSAILNRGALSVEVMLESTLKTLRDNISHRDFDLKHVMNDYVKKNKITGRLEEVGAQLMVGEYASPEG